MSKRRADASLAAAALLFAALGDQTRLTILERLARNGPASITALADTFDISRQAVTKHLNVLAESGVTVLTADRPFYNDYQANTARRIPLIRLRETRPT